MVFTTLPMRRNSPFSGRSWLLRSTDCVRSPRATAAMARENSAVGCTMSAISSLIVSTSSAQEPMAPGSLARCSIRPCLPTASPSRVSSRFLRSARSTTSLKASATSPSTPSIPCGRRALKSPLRKARSAVSSWRLSSSAPMAAMGTGLERVRGERFWGAAAAAAGGMDGIRRARGGTCAMSASGRRCTEPHLPNPPTHAKCRTHCVAKKRKRSNQMEDGGVKEC